MRRARRTDTTAHALSTAAIAEGTRAQTRFTLSWSTAASAIHAERALHAGRARAGAVLSGSEHSTARTVGASEATRALGRTDARFVGGPARSAAGERSLQRADEAIGTTVWGRAEAALDERRAGRAWRHEPADEPTAAQRIGGAGSTRRKQATDAAVEAAVIERALGVVGARSSCRFRRDAAARSGAAQAVGTRAAFTRLTWRWNDFTPRAPASRAAHALAERRSRVVARCSDGEARDADAADRR